MKLLREHIAVETNDEAALLALGRMRPSQRLRIEFAFSLERKKEESIVKMEGLEVSKNPKDLEAEAKEKQKNAKDFFEKR